MYSIIKKLGTGGNSVVNLCICSKCKSRVIIKKANNINLDFTKENSIHSALDHPGIIKVVNTFCCKENQVSKKRHVIFEDFVGIDLFEYIESKPVYSSREVIEIFKQIIDAVYYLHVEANVAHLDIKQENVILKNGTVKLIDFGFSHSIGLCGDTCNLIGGTKCCIPPEMCEYIAIESKKPYKVLPVDIWCLGILLFNLVYGAEPWGYAYKTDTLFNKHLLFPFTSHVFPLFSTVEYTTFHDYTFAQEVLIQILFKATLQVKPENRKDIRFIKKLLQVKGKDVVEYSPKSANITTASVKEYSCKIQSRSN